MSGEMMIQRFDVKWTLTRSYTIDGGRFLRPSWSRSNAFNYSLMSDFWKDRSTSISWRRFQDSKTGSGYTLRKIQHRWVNLNGERSGLINALHGIRLLLGYGTSKTALFRATLFTLKGSKPAESDSNFICYNRIDSYITLESRFYILKFRLAHF